MLKGERENSAPPVTGVPMGESVSGLDRVGGMQEKPEHDRARARAIDALEDAAKGRTLLEWGWVIVVLAASVTLGIAMRECRPGSVPGQPDPCPSARGGE
jgi:hypothetical protein